MPCTVYTSHRIHLLSEIQSTLMNTLLRWSTEMYTLQSVHSFQCPVPRVHKSYIRANASQLTHYNTEGHLSNFHRALQSILSNVLPVQSKPLLQCYSCTEKSAENLTWGAWPLVGEKEPKVRGLPPFLLPCSGSSLPCLYIVPHPLLSP